MPAIRTASASVAVSRRQVSSTESSGAHRQTTAGPRASARSSPIASAVDADEAAALQVAAGRADRRPEAAAAAASAGARTSRVVHKDADSLTADLLCLSIQRRPL